MPTPAASTACSTPPSIAFFGRPSHRPKKGARPPPARGPDAEAGTPPRGPNEWRLEAKGAGVVRVWGLYYELGSNRADTWAIAYTLDGSDPPADTPDAPQTTPPRG